MKEKDAIVDYEPHQMVMFVEKDDGSYGTVRTGSFMAANYVDDFWEKQKNLENMCFEKLTSGEFSPVAYYMTLKDMTPSDVAARIQVRAAAVRKHMNTRHFSTVSIDIARRYADVFGVALADLFQIAVKSDDGSLLTHQSTNNPYVVLTRSIKERK